MWDNADPRSHTPFVGIFSEVFLEKRFHFCKNIMIREMKKSAYGNESKWKFYRDFDFLVGSLTRKKNEIESVEIEKRINFYLENERPVVYPRG